MFGTDAEVADDSIAGTVSPIDNDGDIVAQFDIFSVEPKDACRTVTGSARSEVEVLQPPSVGIGRLRARRGANRRDAEAHGLTQPDAGFRNDLLAIGADLGATVYIPNAGACIVEPQIVRTAGGGMGIIRIMNTNP